MTPDYTIEISTKAKALIYREGDKTFRFEMDTRARPMVVYYHEFSDGSPAGLKTPLTDEVRDTICRRINRYLIENRVAIKVTYLGLRTPLLAHTNSTAEAIQQMVRFFLPRCADQSTLGELDDMASDDQKWRYAHDLFRRIRAKTMRADSAKDKLLGHQYGFEEICAKTLFNMSGHVPGEEFPYPFDDDAPFWVIPIAVRFARALGVADPFSVSSLLQPRDVP